MFTENFITNIIQQNYNLDVSCKILNGYDEYNFLITQVSNGTKYIFKIATEAHDIYFIEAQVAMIEHLNKSSLKSHFQQNIPTVSNQIIGNFEQNNKKYYFRLMTFLEGTFWVEIPEKTKEHQLQLGTFLGKMDSALATFNHPSMNRYYEWDIANTLDSRDLLHHIIDHEKRRIAAYFLLQFETEVIPHQHKLRKACIHNDANDYNVILSNSGMFGLIDFGDAVKTSLINNLAIACTYAMLNTEDPVATAITIVKGYHSQIALTELELSLLYYLIAGRLCISVCKSAYNFSLDSTNEHHFITEKPAWDLLFKLIKVNPIMAENAFRVACNFSSCIQLEDNYTNLLTERSQYIGKNLSISYKEKVKIVKGALQYLYDDKGNTYIDCVNNVSHIGHCHPTLVKAMQKQIATLNTNTRYLNDHLVDFAKELLKTLPSNLEVCYFTNSGSEANDLAIRISRHFTKNHDVIVLDHAYHGTSTVAIEMSPYKFDGKGGFGQKPYIHKAQNPDQYRGEFKYDDPKAGEKYAESVTSIITDLAKQNKKPAAFICETLLGVGGQIALPPNYLKTVYETVREAGGVCIADEVQVGFGRVGDAFWGFELQDVQPDIVVLGKPIGNGHPLAAVVVTREIADSFNNGMEYFNTFGGNPVSMLTGKTVLEIIQKEELQKNAKEVGDYLLNKLKVLKEKYAIIGDVRGNGLFVGVEMVRNPETLEPAVPEIDIIVEKLKTNGFFISTDGPLNNVLKIKPPIIFNKNNADEIVHYLDIAFSELAQSI
ncbi:MAG: aminotransferase class III-fold pyridoxal phosphate-dependent enzyme [Limnohabitans sp.]|nr:aminotransferase class III-fold pyridoxal phosphate-dependent enzyme [Limnohabitans sp.]